MNTAEAQRLLEQHVERLRGSPYDDLFERLDAVDAFEVLGDSGVRYNLEIQVFRDGRRSSNLRVLVSIDDGGLRSLSPLSSGFIIGPDGSFVGE